MAKLNSVFFYLKLSKFFGKIENYFYMKHVDIIHNEQRAKGLRK